jgi:predicted AAA+ superfamily ATPase
MEPASMESAFETLTSEAIKRRLAVENYANRDIYSVISESLQKGPQIVIIAGLRGIGKTTLLLHLSASYEKSLFFSLDHPLFRTIDLYDFVKYLSETKGITHFFVDEAHYYPEWSNDLKALHDWNQELHFVISGSSALGLFRPDRRAKFYFLSPLSFREFLRYSGQKITEAVNWKDSKKSMEIVIKHGLEKHLEKYLRGGGFLTSLNLSKEDFSATYYEAIRKTLVEDAVIYGKMSRDKINFLEKIITFLALSPPGELNYTSLTSSLGAGKGTVIELIHILQQMQLIRVLTPYPSSSAVIRKQPKMLFYHPNLRYILCTKLGAKADLGATREEFVVFHLSLAGYGIYTIKGEKRSPDYVIERGKEKETIEIGGPGKGRKQLPPAGIVVKGYNLIATGLI